MPGCEVRHILSLPPAASIRPVTNRCPRAAATGLASPVTAVALRIVTLRWLPRPGGRRRRLLEGSCAATLVTRSVLNYVGSMEAGMLAEDLPAYDSADVPLLFAEVRAGGWGARDEIPLETAGCLLLLHKRQPG